jgi:hypothetical protein
LPFSVTSPFAQRAYMMTANTSSEVSDMATHFPSGRLTVPAPFISAPRLILPAIPAGPSGQGVLPTRREQGPCTTISNRETAGAPDCWAVRNPEPAPSVPWAGFVRRNRVLVPPGPSTVA